MRLFKIFKAADFGLQGFLGAHVEIERKYLLKSLPPNAFGLGGSTIEQGWLPGKMGRKRLRRTVRGEEEWFTQTVKWGKGLRRLEFEKDLSRERFFRLWPLTEGSRVRKKRYPISEGQYTWELDEFLDRDLCLAEIEFASLDAHIEVPKWLEPYIVREVTDEEGFTNMSLAF